MKIAVTCENNEVFQHFGHTPGFAVFEVEGGKIVSEKQISSGDSGHGALAGLLAEEKVDVLICGGIGAGAINALGVAGISVVGGAEGNVREAAAAFVDAPCRSEQISTAIITTTARDTLAAVTPAATAAVPTEGQKKRKQQS